MGPMTALFVENASRSTKPTHIEDMGITNKKLTRFQKVEDP